MPDFIAHYTGSRTVRISLGQKIGSGASGDIYRISGIANTVAKLYRDRSDLSHYDGKILEMLQRPPNIRPILHSGQIYNQIAWPQASLRDNNGSFVGFIMPEIDMGTATELEHILQRAVRRQRKLPEFYGGRVLLAANLASVMAELHLLSHYFIDMKPINIRFYPQNWYLAIIDTDGFSVQGKRRWPARQYSDQYIAPEAKGQSPTVLGVEQDLFSLAVIIFQLLNNGIHPYQGIDATGQGITSIQDRIYAGLYAYGQLASSQVKPTLTSIHEYIHPTTRNFFDRAFLGNPASRPTAREWSDHLRDLITSNVLIKCNKNPSEHAHFGLGCGFCALDKKQRRQSALKIIATSHLISPTNGATQVAHQTPNLQTKYMPWMLGSLPVIIIAALLLRSPSTPNAIPGSVQPPQGNSQPFVTSMRFGRMIKLAENSYQVTQEVTTLSQATTDMGVDFEYKGAVPGRSRVEIEIRSGNQTISSCSIFTLAYESGRAYCRWNELRLASGQYTVVVSIDGVSRSTRTIQADARSSPPPTPETVRVHKVRWGYFSKEVEGTRTMVQEVEAVPVGVRSVGVHFVYENLSKRSSQFEAHIRSTTGAIMSKCGPYTLSVGQGNGYCVWHDLFLPIGRYRVSVVVDGMDRASEPFRVFERVESKSGPSSRTIPLSGQSYRGFIDGNIELRFSLRRRGEYNGGRAALEGTYVYTRYNRPVQVTGYIDSEGSFSFQGYDNGVLIDTFSGAVDETGNLAGRYRRAKDAAVMSFHFSPN